MSEQVIERELILKMLNAAVFGMPWVEAAKILKAYDAKSTALTAARAGVARLEDELSAARAERDAAREIVEAATELESPHGPTLGDDALIHAGSALCGDWRNYVSTSVVEFWPNLTQQARLAVYLTAKLAASREGGK